MPTQLSEQARTILELIADGYSFEQLLNEYTAGHLQDAAREALEVDSANRPAPLAPDDRVKTNPRTYEVWTDKEDTLLMDMLQGGSPLPDIATELERHPMTVRRRIAQLGLT
jgi:DNA-binding NarL/FixJ family response regulator